MLILFILNWGKDIIIQPVPSFQHVKDLKNRINNPNFDYVVYSSQYLTPIKFDNINTQLDDETLTELYSSNNIIKRKRPPIFDAEGNA